MKKQESKNNIIYSVIAICVACILITVFILINTKVIRYEAKKEKEKATEVRVTKPSTTTVFQEKGVISVNGKDIIINVETYKSHFGFLLKYDKEFFIVKSLSDTSVEFSDSIGTSYVKINPISGATYESELSLNETITEVDNLQIYTVYKKIGNNYFRIDECIDKTTGQDSEFDARFNYLLTSLEAR